MFHTLIRIAENLSPAGCTDAEWEAAKDAICQPFERRTVVLFTVFLAVLAVCIVLKGVFA